MHQNTTYWVHTDARRGILIFYAIIHKIPVLLWYMLTCLCKRSHQQIKAIHVCIYTYMHPTVYFFSFCYVLIYASIGQIQLQYILIGLAKQHRLNGHSPWSISSRRLLAEKTMRTNKPTDIWRPPSEVVIVGIVCRERSLPSHMEALKQSLHLISLVGPKEKKPYR